jgi:hypothetical protein
MRLHPKQTLRLSSLGFLVPSAVTVRQPEVTGCNLTAPIATVGALSNYRELLLHPNCTQIFPALI